MILGAGAFAQTDGSNCRVLQITESRIYFNCGTEALVYPYADFIIEDSADTLYSGEIEYSLPGISISYPSDSIKTIGLPGNYSVTINRARPDTIDNIDIMIVPGLFDNFRKAGLFSNAKIRITEDTRGESSVRPPDIRIGLQYKKYPEYSRIDSIPAPFYFAMIPNLDKDINSRGYLTTSLYYHHNLYKTGLLVEADGILNYNRNYPAGDTAGRIYQYSTVKGGELFRNGIKPGTEIKIFYDFGGLKEFAQYFATFISRYGCRASFVIDSAEADIRCIRIPIIPDSSTGSMRAILTEIESKKRDDKALMEKLKLIDDYLGFAETSTDASGENRYLKMADNILQTEIGVFPLFRPVIYIMYNKDIVRDIGIAYDALDFGEISRLKLPVPGKDSL